MEDDINKQINELNDPNLSYEQKRLKVLSEINNSKFIDFSLNTLEIIDIEEIRRYEEEIILEKMRKIKEDNLTEFQKRLIILDEMNLSLSYDSIKDEDEGDKSHYQLVSDEKQKIPDSILKDISYNADLSANSTMTLEYKDMLTYLSIPSKVKDKTKGLNEPSKVKDISADLTLPSEIKDITKRSQKLLD